jgi:nucleoside-diphosphate-sugar epimerase
MRVAITGASGYVGGVLSAAFQRAGWEVLALSRRPCAGLWHAYALGDDPSALPWAGVDALVHAAHDFVPRHWADIVARNIEPGRALLRAAQSAGVARLLFISSISAYEGCRSHYGRAKLLLEQESLALGADVVRPGLVWGPTPGGVMGSLEKAVTRLPLVPCLSGAGGLAQYLVHEDDLATCVRVLCEGGGPGGLHSATHPDAVPLRRILETIATRRGLRRSFLPVPWQVVMAGLRTLEALGVTPPFRSDSLVGLVHRNPQLTDETRPPGVSYRPFA